MAWQFANLALRRALEQVGKGGLELRACVEMSS